MRNRLVWITLFVLAFAPVSGAAPSSSKGQVFRTPEPPSEAKLGDVWVNPTNSGEMVYVPAGEFLMGSLEEERVAADAEHPQHRVCLDAFWMDKTEVTVGEYRRFCNATGQQMLAAPAWGWHDDHPVVNVAWEDAAAYAEWAGKRLPTEAEWEKAARGTDGRAYPWGNQWDPGKCAHKHGSTEPTGSYPTGASPYGALDMAGNVWEWCADWCDEQYYRTAPATNPKGPTTGRYRSFRGGCWRDGDARYFRCALRFSFANFSFGRFEFVNIKIGSQYIGFRCVRGPGGAAPAGATPTAPYQTTPQTKTDDTRLSDAGRVLRPPEPPEEAQQGDVWVNPTDGGEMVYVPAGAFLMGSTESDKYAQTNEKPQLRMYLPGYWIDKCEVTVAQYCKFCLATRRIMPSAPKWGWHDDHPVVNVAWEDAAAYAEWAGKRLPTEAEWEKAARGTDGRAYPWGNQWDPGKCAHKHGSTEPTGSYPTGASPYGALDMAGSVWEWCADWYEEDAYQRYARGDLHPPTHGTIKMLRGGSCYLDHPRYFRSAYRTFYLFPDLPSFSGFRCVKEAR